MGCQNSKANAPKAAAKPEIATVPAEPHAAATLLENGADGQKTPAATEAPSEQSTDAPAETAAAQSAAATPAESSEEQAMELATLEEVAEPAPEETAASPQVAVAKKEASLEKIEPVEMQLTAGVVAPATKGGFFFFSCCSPA